MYINIYIQFLVRGGFMQLGRDMLMVALGAMGVLVLQKCSEPMKRKMDCMLDSAIDMTTNKMDKVSNAIDKTSNKLEKMK